MANIFKKLIQTSKEQKSVKAVLIKKPSARLLGALTEKKGGKK